MAAEINLTALRTSGYAQQEPPRAEDFRMVYRYQLPLLADIGNAAKSINAFLQDNPQLIFVSPPKSAAGMNALIESHRFLVINGNTVCLSKKGKAPVQLDLLCKDLFFSEAVIEEPVQCTFNHFFEKRHIDVYLSSRGHSNCPYSGTTPHPIETTEVDPYIQARMRGVVQAFEENCTAQKEASKIIEKLEADRGALDLQIQSQKDSVKPDRTGELIGGGVKLSYKAGVTALHATKAGNKALKSYGKTIPILSVGIGVFFGIYRVIHGYQTRNHREYAKAVGEVVSGVAGSFPGIGSGVALAIDVSMGADDLNEVYGSNSNNKSVDLKLEDHLDTLGLSGDPKPTQTEIESKYRVLSKRFTHSDARINRGLNGINMEMLNQFQNRLTQSKDFLIKHYGYQ